MQPRAGSKVTRICKPPVCNDNVWGLPADGVCRLLFGDEPWLRSACAGLLATDWLSTRVW